MKENKIEYTSPHIIYSIGDRRVEFGSNSDSNTRDYVYTIMEMRDGKNLGKCRQCNILELS